MLPLIMVCCVIVWAGLLQHRPLDMGRRLQRPLLLPGTLRSTPPSCRPRCRLAVQPHQDSVWDVVVNVDHKLNVRTPLITHVPEEIRAAVPVVQESAFGTAGHSKQ
jgi:hypothetical protein